MTRHTPQPPAEPVPGAVAQLLHWVHVTERECQLLAGLRPVAEAAAGSFAAECLARIQDDADRSGFLERHSADAAQVLGKWFTDLFGGVYDAAYARSRLEISEAQVRLGLPARYPVALLDIAIRYGTAVARDAGPEAVEAFRNVLALDLAAITQAHEENRLGHLGETLDNEQAWRAAG